MPQGCLLKCLCPKYHHFGFKLEFYFFIFRKIVSAVRIRMSLSPVLQLENDSHSRTPSVTPQVIEEMIKHTHRNSKSSAKPQPLSGHTLSNEQQEDGVARGIIELHLVGSPTLIVVLLSIRYYFQQTQNIKMHNQGRVHSDSMLCCCCHQCSKITDKNH